jgi:hypothetical protein
VQRRPVVGVFTENQIGIFFQQSLDLFQVSRFCRFMNLSAKGKAAPSHCDQHGDGEAGK